MAKAAIKKSETLSKKELLERLAASTNLSKAQVDSVLDQLSVLAREQLKLGSELTIPGLLKVKAVTKPATAERTGVDPFTKQQRVFKARPAFTSVKAVPLKVLRDSLADDGKG